MLTKESALFFPLVAIFYFKFISKKKIFSRQGWLLLAGWLSVVIIWFLLRKNAFNVPAEMNLIDLIKAVFHGLPSLPQFIGKIIFPFNLTVLPIIQDTTFVYGILAIILIGGLIVFSKNKRWNYIFFGLLWFLVFLLPSFIRPNPDIIADFIEHRLYVPIIGFIIILLEIDLIKLMSLNRQKDLIIFFINNSYFFKYYFFLQQ